MVVDMVQGQIQVLQLLDEMVEVEEVVLVFLEVLVQEVQQHKGSQEVHQIQVVDELVEVEVQVLLVKMDNFLQILVMVVLVLRTRYQEVR
jgi:hypothetical protein